MNHPCLCDICLEARGKELKRVEKAVREETLKEVEKAIPNKIINDFNLEGDILVDILLKRIKEFLINNGFNQAVEILRKEIDEIRAKYEKGEK